MCQKGEENFQEKRNENILENEKVIQIVKSRNDVIWKDIDVINIKNQAPKSCLRWCITDARMECSEENIDNRDWR